MFVKRPRDWCPAVGGPLLVHRDRGPVTGTPRSGTRYCYPASWGPMTFRKQLRSSMWTKI